LAFSMENNLQKELDKNRFFVVKYGIAIVITIFMIIILSLVLLKIENESILKLVVKYFFH